MRQRVKQIAAAKLPNWWNQHGSAITWLTRPAWNSVTSFSINRGIPGRLDPNPNLSYQALTLDNRSYLCLSAQASKLYAMGFRDPVRRSTLADANEGRDWRIYAKLAQRLIAQARKLYLGEDLGFDLANTVSCCAVILILLKNLRTIISPVFGQLLLVNCYKMRAKRR